MLHIYFWILSGGALVIILWAWWLMNMVGEFIAYCIRKYSNRRAV
jgi:hypothetical protein